MKKKRNIRSVGNTLVKEPGPEERALPEGIQPILDHDEEQRRIRLAEIKNKIASGRYNVSSEEVAKAIVDHIVGERETFEDPAETEENPDD